MANPIEAVVPYQEFGHERVLSVGSSGIYSAAGLVLHKRIRDLEGGRSVRLARGWKLRASRFWPAERAMRLGLRRFEPYKERSAFVITPTSIVLLNTETLEVKSTFEFVRRARPLNVLTFDDGFACFGEYLGNKARGPVSVYATDEGYEWYEAWRFPPNTIRHIHGIYHDSYRNGIWLLAGDDGDEAGLWFTDDRFDSLVPVVVGTQRARAVTVIPTEHGLVVPMDSPDERNYIHIFEPERNEFREVGELAGSSIAAVNDGNIMLVSTAVEKSKVNKDQYVTIVGSLTGETWRPIFRVKRDFSFMRNMRPWLQHPNASFPTTDGTSNRVFSSLVAVKKLDGVSISWDRDELHSYLS